MKLVCIGSLEEFNTRYYFSGESFRHMGWARCNSTKVQLYHSLQCENNCMGMACMAYVFKLCMTYTQTPTRANTRTMDFFNNGQVSNILVFQLMETFFAQRKTFSVGATPHLEHNRQWISEHYRNSRRL